MLTKDYFVTTTIGLILFIAIAFIANIRILTGLESDIISVLIEECGKSLVALIIFRGTLAKWCILSFSAWELILGKGLMMYSIGAGAHADIIDKNIVFFSMLSVAPIFMHMATERLYFLLRRPFFSILVSCALHFSFNSVSDLPLISDRLSPIAALPLLAGSAIIYGVLCVISLTRQNA